MNKNIIIAAVVGIVILVGGFMLMNSSSNDSANLGGSNSAMEKHDDSETGFIQGNLQQLMARGSAIECTFDHISDQGMTAGVVYISGKDMRGDFVLTQNDGTEITSNMIRKGNTNYIWSSQFEDGIMTTIQDVETVDDIDIKDDPQNGGDVFSAIEDENVNYSCKPWKVDNDMLTPPSDIEFIDLSKQMEQIQQADDSIQELQCSACDQAPAGAAREQCLQALGCN